MSGYGSEKRQQRQLLWRGEADRTKFGIEKRSSVAAAVVEVDHASIGLIKYGGGPVRIVRLLADESRLISRLESDRLEVPLRRETVEATYAVVMRLLRLASDAGNQEDGSDGISN